MRLRFWMAWALVALGFNLAVAAPSTARAPQGLDTGSGQFRFVHRGESLDVFSYKPATYAGGPIVVVLHGQGRNADEYRDYAIPLADAQGAIVVTPRFDRDRFPGERYQRGNVLQGRAVQAPEAWTYATIPALVDEVRRREGRPDLPYYLIGHSAGGQFLIRLAAMMPGEAVRIVPANPGSLLFPTRDANWGYGFGRLPEHLSNDDALRAYLAAPVTLLLGTADTNLDDADLDRSNSAMAQGPQRFARGHACFAAAQALAAERGWPFNWKVIEVPGVGHSGRRMIGSPQARAALFGD